jgi:hypothetical protein
VTGRTGSARRVQHTTMGAMPEGESGNSVDETNTYLSMGGPKQAITEYSRSLESVESVLYYEVHPQFS